MSELLPDWLGPVLHLNRTDSTQDVARKMAEEGSPEWTLVVADRQSKGRGRLGRNWDSSHGGLYLSLILRPPVPPTSLAHLSLTAASAVAKALAAVSGLKTAVKPPNDVLAAPPGAPEPAGALALPPGPGSLKKVCGILAEASGDSTHTEWVVLGFGVNINNKTPRKLARAGTLSELAGREFDVAEVLREVLAEFRKEYAQFLQTYRRGMS